MGARPKIITSAQIVGEQGVAIVKERIHEISTGLPEGVSIQPVYDRSDLIHRAIDNLNWTLVEESLIVALVCIVFLFHARSALVAIVMLPIGVLMALRARDRTGRGQVVDLALYESVFRVLDELAPAYAATGYVRGREGIGTANACPHGHFQCGDGRWVAIACTSDKMFERLAQAMGRPELAADDAYGRVAARLADRAKVDGLVGVWTGSMSREAAIEVPQPYRLPRISPDGNRIALHVLSDLESEREASIWVYNLKTKASVPSNVSAASIRPPELIWTPCTTGTGGIVRFASFPRTRGLTRARRTRLRRSRFSG